MIKILFISNSITNSQWQENENPSPTDIRANLSLLEQRSESGPLEFPRSWLQSVIWFVMHMNTPEEVCPFCRVTRHNSLGSMWWHWITIVANAPPHPSSLDESSPTPPTLNKTALLCVGVWVATIAFFSPDSCTKPRSEPKDPFLFCSVENTLPVVGGKRWTQFERIRSSRLGTARAKCERFFLTPSKWKPID